MKCNRQRQSIQSEECLLLVSFVGFTAGETNTTAHAERIRCCCTSLLVTCAGQSTAVCFCCATASRAAPAIGEWMMPHSPAVQCSTCSATLSTEEEAVSVSRRATAVFGMCIDGCGVRSAPKLTRHTGVGNGLLNGMPYGSSKRMGFDSTHTDTACCSACTDMYVVCARKGTSTMLCLCLPASSAALCSHSFASPRRRVHKVHFTAGPGCVQAI
jgi:hypothetical protein